MRLSVEQSGEWPPVIIWAGIEGAYLPRVDGLQAQPPQPFLPCVGADVQVSGCFGIDILGVFLAE